MNIFDPPLQTRTKTITVCTLLQESKINFVFSCTTLENTSDKFIESHPSNINISYYNYFQSEPQTVIIIFTQVLLLLFKTNNYYLQKKWNLA